MFSRMFYAACLAGLVCGLLLTAMQAVSVVPIILEAETYEVAAPVDAKKTDGHRHDHGEAWAPGDGLERTAWTSISNIATAIGFSLIVVAVLVWRGRTGVKEGLLWGGVGFVMFFASPSLGLAPEIPGTFSADLLDRQVWWIGAAVSAAGGLGALIIAPQPLYKAIGALLVFVPHIIGAPHPDVMGGNAPQALADQFVVASAITNAVFWAALGISSAYAYVWMGRGGQRSAASPFSGS